MIENIRKVCNFNCSFSSIILVLDVFNNYPFNEIPLSTSSFINSIAHIYFTSSQKENDKKIYYENIIKFFNINVL